jgi:hypothetical protein
MKQRSVKIKHCLVKIKQRFILTEQPFILAIVDLSVFKRDMAALLCDFNLIFREECDAKRLFVPPLCAVHKTKQAT